MQSKGYLDRVKEKRREVVIMMMIMQSKGYLDREERKSDIWEIIVNIEGQTYSLQSAYHENVFSFPIWVHMRQLIASLITFSPTCGFDSDDRSEMQNLLQGIAVLNFTCDQFNCNMLLALTFSIFISIITYLQGQWTWTSSAWQWNMREERRASSSSLSLSASLSSAWSSWSASSYRRVLSDYTEEARAGTTQLPTLESLHLRGDADDKKILCW